ncbi:transcription factor bHLH47-like isoform X1 [Hibiscus syriacus]|uniref:transcription factor bHLH47-like isoform X1 n=1 Tax=Hibiscus syriacus TaxID=106335 RepID=UPI0019204FB6|nr:transcription factor bHLH47-like isoform X1 [Hibiscus syriacus]XP_039011788.1 transcription factor bHLH47-like isoform X1 [Hibiscus syriacus]
MGSETPATLVEQTNAAVKTSVGRSCAPKTKGKVPKRIHKAEREKLKREHLNELFLDLANALDPNQPNNGKASILCEATRLLKDLFCQIESLKKENSSLLSESHYVNIEKNELKEENFTLETQIRELQSDIGTKMAQSKPNLKEPRPDFQQTQLPSHFHGDQPGLPAVKPAPQQPSALLVVPLHPDINLPLNQTPLSGNHMLDIQPLRIHGLLNFLGSNQTLGMSDNFDDRKLKPSLYISSYGCNG